EWQHDADFDCVLGDNAGGREYADGECNSNSNSPAQHEVLSCPCPKLRSKILVVQSAQKLASPSNLNDMRNWCVPLSTLRSASIPCSAAGFSISYRTIKHPPLRFGGDAQLAVRTRYCTCACKAQ